MKTKKLTPNSFANIPVKRVQKKQTIKIAAAPMIGSYTSTQFIDKKIEQLNKETIKRANKVKELAEKIDIELTRVNAICFKLMDDQSAGKGKFSYPKTMAKHGGPLSVLRSEDVKARIDHAAAWYKLSSMKIQEAIEHRDKKLFHMQEDDIILYGATYFTPPVTDPGWK